MDFTQEQIQEIVNIQKEFSTLNFDDAFKRIEKITEHFSIITREQYRLFCAFCLYKTKCDQNSPVLPPQISNFHERLLMDIQILFPPFIKDRWKSFGSPIFITTLEAVSKGDPKLTKIINLIKTPADGLGFLRMMENTQANPNGSLEIKPAFLHFLPQKPNPSKNVYITPDEYKNFKQK